MKFSLKHSSQEVVVDVRSQLFLNPDYCAQIIEEDASLVEIGPRFVLNLIKIFQGSFGGPTLYENPGFQSPNLVGRNICHLNSHFS